MLGKTKPDHAIRGHIPIHGMLRISEDGKFVVKKTRASSNTAMMKLSQLVANSAVTKILPVFSFFMLCPRILDSEDLNHVSS